MLWNRGGAVVVAEVGGGRWIDRWVVVGGDDRGQAQAGCGVSSRVQDRGAEGP